MEAFVLLLSSFAASGVLWTWQTRARAREAKQRQRQLAGMLDEGMQVALHLARHEAATRQQPLGALHLLYAVTQDERVSAAIEQLGGDRAGLEAAIEAKLDEPPADPDPRAGTQLLGGALALAHGHGRTMTCVDAIALLLRSPAGALLDRAPITGDALLFALVHGEVPPTTLPRETHVHVVLRNDDFTPMPLVVHVLETVFDLTPEPAGTLMRAVHEGGRAVVGRFAVEDARARIERGRDLARAQHAPLWLGVEAC